MPLITSPGFTDLEEELFGRIDKVKEKDPFASLAVVVPTGRILSRLRRVILESNRAYLGVHFLHHRAFAERILEGDSGSPSRVAGVDLLLPLLETLLAARSETGSVTRFARRHPGAMAALLGTLRDLRDAAADPEKLGGLLPATVDPDELGEIYSSYCRAIESLEEAGITDAAGHVQRAIRFSPRSPFLSELRAVFPFGAYDLIQVHQDLLMEVSRRVPMTFLLPGIGDGPAFRYAARFLERPLALAMGPPTRAAGAEAKPAFLSERLDGLYDDAAALPPPLTGERVEVITAAGARFELEAVARRVLRAQSEGVPLHEIGVVARTLEPYLPHLEAVFDSFGLPFVSSAAQPLLRYPGPLAFLKLLRVLADDFPRAETADLFRSPALRLEEQLGTSKGVHPDRWDLWSRKAGIAAGRKHWIDRLPAKECASLVKFINLLGREADLWAKEKSWPGHARFLQRLASSWLRRFDDDTAGPEIDLAGVLDTLGAREAGERAAGGTAPPVDRNQARQRLECLLAEAAHQPTSPSEEGVAVLDAMQARGESFRILFLIGLSNDQWPRRIHPDPYLPDGERRKLQEKFGIQIPLKETAREEDRLLMALLLGAARDRLILSFQRADDGGRAKAHSTVWREIARIVAGNAEAAALLEDYPEIRIVPTDPTRRAEFELRPGRGCAGLLDEKEGAILAAGSAADPVAGLLTQMEGMGRLTGGIARGAEYLRAVNRWNSADLEWDGSIGKILPARKYLSASRIGTMGRCPLQYFFGYGLGVEELEEPERGEPIDKGLVGNAIHAVLEIVYRRLVEEKRFPIADGPGARKRAVAILREAGPGAVEPVREILAARFPLLWSIYEKEWYASLESFLDFDLRRMEKEKVESVVTEEMIEAEVPLPTRNRVRPLGLKGILDRVDRLPGDRIRIADYKTSRNLVSRVDKAQILKGNQVQMPIYVFLARQKYSPDLVQSAQILGVGPENPDPGGAPAETSPEIQVPPDPADVELWRGFGDTIWQLAAMIDRGLFPFREGGHCDWCAYRPACRKDHAPSADRVEAAADFRPFHDLAKRSTRKIFGPEEVS